MSWMTKGGSSSALGQSPPPFPLNELARGGVASTRHEAGATCCVDGWRGLGSGERQEVGFQLALALRSPRKRHLPCGRIWLTGPTPAVPLIELAVGRVDARHRFALVVFAVIMVGGLLMTNEAEQKLIPVTLRSLTPLARNQRVFPSPRAFE